MYLPSRYLRNPFWPSTQALQCYWMNQMAGLICLFCQHLPLLEGEAMSYWDARGWPVSWGLETFSYSYSCTHLAYKVVLLKMYLAQENIVKSQLAKISRKLWLLLGYKMPWLLRLPPAYEWAYPWRLKVGIERLYYFLQYKPLNWHICWKQRCQKCDSLRSKPCKKATCHYLTGIKILSGC